MCSYDIYSGWDMPYAACVSPVSLVDRVGKLPKANS